MIVQSIVFKTMKEPGRMSLPADAIPQKSVELTTPLRFVTAASLFDGHDAS